MDAARSAALAGGLSPEAALDTGRLFRDDGRRPGLAAAAVDRLGHLLAQHVTAADQQYRPQVERLAAEVQRITEQNVELAYVDQASTGEAAAEAANKQGIQLQVVKHTEAKRGFLLLPRRWMVERSFAWAARFRRLARDCQRLSDTLAASHYFAFAWIMLAKIFTLLNQS